MSENKANDLLMGGGVKACKFDNLGDTVVGTIVEDPKAEQMRKYKTDELDFWPSGDPKMQVVVMIQTDLREDAQDDGRRRLYIPPRMMPPVREAVQRAGAKGLAIGGRIAVRWFAGSGEGEGNPKQYQADYAAPAMDPGSLLAGAPAAVAAAALSAAAPVQAAAPATSFATGGPVYQPAPAVMAGAPAPVAQAASTSLLSAAPSVSPANAAPPNGVDPAVWATLPEVQRAAILAAMVNPAASAPAF